VASDVFLKVDGIKGESTDAYHKDEIELVGWSWGASEVFIVSGGGGTVGGKPKFTDLVVTKHVDKASPKLLRACLKVTHISEVVLTQRKAGAGKLNFLVITLKDALVTSLNDAESEGASRPMETVQFNFAKVIYEVIARKPNGQPGTPVTLRWDVKTNKEF
jgi:type VI secretion system secreted protein Hcp